MVSDKARRKELVANNFGAFVVFYFGKSFSYKFPNFHKLFWLDAEALTNNELTEALWIGFAESAKTTTAKLLALWWICCAKKKYINFDAYDKTNSENSLFDIVTWLQTNTRLRKDFGDLYTEERHDLEEKKLKRVSQFITTNKIKVEAFSIGTSPRGRLYDNNRPDAYVIDDIENKKTIKSATVTQTVIDHIKEVRRGAGTTCSIVFCANYITDGGSVRFLRDTIEKDPRGIVRDIPVKDRKTGEIAWKDKYVETDEEAAHHNKTIYDKQQWKVSLESKKRSLGDSDFEAEMQNNPSASGDNIFTRSKMDELLRYVQPPIENNAGFKMWKRYNPAHSYGIGADTAEGEGGDSNASVLIDFKVLPNEQVGSYSNNRIPPDTFGFELKRQGYMFGACLIAPELNNTGFATVTALKPIYPAASLYRREEMDKAQNKMTKKIGWRSTEANKYQIIYDLRSAVEDGILVIRDEDILKEMREFTQNDLRDVRGLVTRHFDLLKACAIAWAIRSQAKPSELTRQDYKQPDYEPSSPFEVSGGRGKRSEGMFDMFEDQPSVEDEA